MWILESVAPAHGTALRALCVAGTVALLAACSTVESSAGDNAGECTPDCSGKWCGDDGCGGQCGVCPDWAPSCVQGTCQMGPAPGTDAGSGDDASVAPPVGQDADGGPSNDVGSSDPDATVAPDSQANTQLLWQHPKYYKLILQSDIIHRS